MSKQIKRWLSLIIAVILFVVACFVALEERAKFAEEADGNQLFVVSQNNILESKINKIEDLFTQEVSAAELEEVIDEIQEVAEVSETQEVIEESIVEEVIDEPVVEEPIIEEPEVQEEVVYDDEFMTICSVVEAETKGQDMDSKIHIVHVIRNRVNHPTKFDNDYYSVCTASNQFASRWDIEQSTIDAVNAALSMEDTTGGALYFCLCKESCWLLGTEYEWLFQDSAGHHFWG